MLQIWTFNRFHAPSENTNKDLILLTSRWFVVTPKGTHSALFPQKHMQTGWANSSDPSSILARLKGCSFSSMHCSCGGFSMFQQASSPKKEKYKNRWTRGQCGDRQLNTGCRAQCSALTSDCLALISWTPHYFPLLCTTKLFHLKRKLLRTEMMLMVNGKLYCSQQQKDLMMDSLFIFRKISWNPVIRDWFLFRSVTFHFPIIP